MHFFTIVATIATALLAHEVAHTFPFKTYDKNNTRLFLSQEQRKEIKQKWELCKKNTPDARTVIPSHTIHVVALSTPNRKELWPYTIDSIRRYCTKHGYSFSLSEKLPRPMLYPNWNKIAVINEHCKTTPDNEWLVWIDDDMVITNNTIKLESFINAAGAEKEFIIGEDGCSHEGIPCNTGIFLVKNTPLMRVFFNHIELHGLQSGYLTLPSLMEQESLTDLLRDNLKYSSATQIMPLGMLQSFYGNQASSWQPGDFIAHFAGIQNVDRLKLLKEFFAKHTFN